MIKQIKAFAGDYRVAGLKFFTGREGYGWEGQLFKGDVYLGRCGDGANGGPVLINVVNGAEFDLLKQHAVSKVDSEYEQVELFLTYLTSYQDSIRKLKTKAKKEILIVKANVKLDERGVPEGYTFIKFADNPANRAKVMAKYPDAVIINDEVFEFDVPRAKRS
jgi:hypothetical protein